MTEERTIYFAAFTASGRMLRTFETQGLAEQWQDANTIFPGALVEQVTTVTTREPIKRRKLRLVRSGT